MNVPEGFTHFSRFGLHENDRHFLKNSILTFEIKTMR